MDYIFNEDVFKNNFNVQDLDTNGADTSRLRHIPDKKFRLFPYRANGKIYIVTEVEEIISEFFKLILLIDTKDLQYEILCEKIKENIDIAKEDEPFFDKTVRKLFFKNGKFVTNNVGLYAYQNQCEYKSMEDLAFFFFCVFCLDENECKNIKSVIEKYPNNVLEELLVHSISVEAKERELKEKKYFPIITGIQEKFKKDFRYMLLNGMTSLEDLAKLFDLYYVYYISQACVVLDNFCSGSREQTVDFYYALDWEKVSGNRKCCTHGWRELQQNVNHLFCHAITLELVNQHTGEEMYDYISLGEFVKNDMEKDRLVANEIQKVEEAYKSCIGDCKRIYEIPYIDDPYDTKTNQAIRHLFKCVEEQFIHTERKRANRFYIDKFEKYAKSRWLKNRRKSGMVLNLTERDIIFLTKISLADSDKIKLEELFKEYESRGIFLDNTSKKLLQEFFTKLNLIDKKSDSGDAQYVKRIL